ncbi:hypothetical protein [Actinoplanes sp. DH11]|uniref:hypothetical protein n=1 Tax=Actinoplanes sp. DH11 TaxID=2857011 RepID=UPI001E3F4733|nr:hypothetical protein [Actinoplanes sp. DH11]
MDDSPLRRLLAHHQVVDPGERTPAALGALAPLLGWRAADLFVLAGRPVPAELAAAPNPGGSPHVGKIMDRAVMLGTSQRRRLHAMIRRMPVSAPSEPMPAPEPGQPGQLVQALARNRGIRLINVQTLMIVGDGPYVSQSTVHMVCADRAELTPQYVSAFAALFGMPVDDVAAATGVGGAPTNRRHPDAAALAELVWDARRLTAEQIREVLAATTGAEDDPRRYCLRCRARHHPGMHEPEPGLDVDAVTACEQRLDGLLRVLNPDWTVPPLPPLGELNNLLNRVHYKRAEVADRLEQRPDHGADLGSLVLDAILHEISGSTVRRFVTVMCRALGERALAERLIAAAATGTPPERAAAARAWPWITGMWDPDAADLRLRFRAAVG